MKKIFLILFGLFLVYIIAMLLADKANTMEMAFAIMLAETNFILLIANSLNSTEKKEINTNQPLKVTSHDEKIFENHDKSTFEIIVNDPDLENKKQTYTNIKSKNDEIDYFYKKYSDFDLNSFLANTKSEYIEMCNYLRSGNLQNLYNLCSESFITNKMYEDVDYKDVDVSNIYNSCKILNVGYSRELDEICVILNSNTKIKVYDKKTKKEIKGLTTSKMQSYLLRMVKNKKYISSTKHCTNCGAPIKNLLRFTCESCGANIIRQYEWLIKDIQKL